MNQPNEDVMREKVKAHYEQAYRVKFNKRLPLETVQMLYKKMIQLQDDEIYYRESCRARILLVR